MRPLIGIVGRINSIDKNKISINDEYRRIIVEYGGNVFTILPPSFINYGETKFNDLPPLSEEEKNMLIQQLDMCDGILIPGGNKMLNSDFFILDYAIKKDIPILGICLGMQVMVNYKRPVWNEPNIESGINHNVKDGSLVHFVTIDKNSKLYKILNEETFMVNSIHNYHAVASFYYKTVGYSEDGLIEAIEMESNTFNIGVQWHPEKMPGENGKKLISSFVEAAKANMNKWKINIFKANNLVKED